MYVERLVGDLGCDSEFMVRMDVEDVGIVPVIVMAMVVQVYAGRKEKKREKRRKGKGGEKREIMCIGQMWRPDIVFVGLM